MQHRFFKKTPKQQFIIQFMLVTMVISICILLTGILNLLNIQPLMFLIVLFFSISLTIIAPFVDVPLGVRSGSLIYYSPLLIGEAIKNNVLTIHGGTFFDYYYVLNKGAGCSERKKMVLLGYIQGLINLIEQHENLQPSGIKIKATSYILNSRTATKLGLRKVQTDMLQRAILYFNYFNLMSSYSLMNAKLSLLKISRVQTYEGDLDDLIAKKDYLLALKNRL